MDHSAAAAARLVAAVCGQAVMTMAVCGVAVTVA